MRIPSEHLHARQSDGTSGGSNTNTGFIIATAVIIGFISFLVLGYVVLRILRAKNYGPKYIPTKHLKRRWNNWTPNGVYNHVFTEVSTNPRDANTSYPPTGEAQNQGPLRMLSNVIRRETSIRSIMTLPSYSATPKPEEQVVARAGEREGMDMVVEFPETVDEEESRREEEMQSLYQIRLRRRQEIEEREERRRQRREARAAGDFARLEQLRQEEAAVRATSNSDSAAAMLTEHLSRGRDRRVSAVSYADLGEVRHDGSRIRANSTESDQQPLLEAAAPNGRNSTHSLPISAHSRGYSGSSVLTTTTTLTGSQDSNSLRLTPSRPVTLSDQEETDVGQSHIPPPDYEHLDWGEAPAYESPTAERAVESTQLTTSDLEAFPAIRISTATPEPETPATALTPQTSNASHSEHHSSDGN